jgi:hypothetical protein
VPTNAMPYSDADFVRDAEVSFRFLVEDYGYRIESTRRTVGSDARVIYESEVARVFIYLDSRGAVEVTVRRSVPDFGSAAVEEIARAAGATDASRYGELYDPTTSTPEATLRRLADGLRRYGASWLRPSSAAGDAAG